MSEMIMSITSTVILIILIIVVYYNNNEINKLNDSAININQYIKKGEVNDDHIFKSNSNIINYLRSRDSMKQELELLKQKVKTNTEKNIEQDNKLAQKTKVDDEQNRKINMIRDTYRSDMNYLVNLSFTEVQKHFPGVSNDENLKMFRELLYKYVLLSLRDYNNFLPDYELDKFINVFGTEVSFILSESIYKYKIYNSFDKFPSANLFIKAAVEELKNPIKLDFFIKTYFPRMFNYIESNTTILFRRIKNSSTLYTSIDREAEFVKAMMNDTNIDISTIDPLIRKYLFIDLPDYYTRSLYYNSDQTSYLKEIEDNIIQISLKACSLLKIFYDTWKLYNVVKKSGSNLIIQTEKTKLFSKLINNNPIFETIYIDKVNDYNKELETMTDCDLPFLPTEYKAVYEEADITYPKK